MSIIGHRAHITTHPHITGTIIGTRGAEKALVEWDEDSLTNYFPTANLTVNAETVAIDVEPLT